MPSSGGGSQTVTNKVELPEWVNKASEENYNFAKDLSGKLPGAYQGNVVAPFSGTQTQAFDAAKGMVGAQNGNMANAIGAAQGAAAYKPQNVQAGSFLSGNVGAYMNPYTQNVIDASKSQYQDAFKNNLNTIGANATAARAFGGSRQGVAEGAAAAQNAQNFGQFAAGLQQQGFDKASALMQADQNRALTADVQNQNAGLTANQQAIQGAFTAGNLAQTAQGMGYKDVAALQAVGDQEQGLEQQKLTQDAARFQAEKQAQLEPLNLRLSALGMSPYGQTQTQTSTGGTTGSNPFMGALGGASAGASIFSALGGSAALGSSAGVGMSSLGALLGIFSDENEKTNVQPLGRDKITGLPIYAYDYKSDVAAAKKEGSPMPPKRVGPMAQDIEKVAPQAVGKVGGKRVVNLGLGALPKGMGRG
jgi:hypothetical protein